METEKDPITLEHDAETQRIKVGTARRKGQNVRPPTRHHWHDDVNPQVQQEIRQGPIVPTKLPVPATKPPVPATKPTIPATKPTVQQEASSEVPQKVRQLPTPPDRSAKLAIQLDRCLKEKEALTKKIAEYDEKYKASMTNYNKYLKYKIKYLTLLVDIN